MSTTEKIEPKFKVGDPVQLASGGFCMTVTYLLTRPMMSKPGQPCYTGYVQTCWFEDNLLKPENLHRGTFPQDALIPCSPDS